MPPASQSVVIVGAGIFGVTAALELRRRGWTVTLLEAGQTPRDTAASTDISKVVRMDYGADEFYTAMGEASLEGWDRWNVRWGEPPYHEDGFLLLTRDRMQSGGFEYDSFAILTQRGHRLDRVSPERLRERHPAWPMDRYTDGYFNSRGGWAESGRVVARLVGDARAAGVGVREHSPFGSFMESDDRITGVVTRDGKRWLADRVLVAAGAWTPVLLPELAGVMRVTGQPVVHFKVPDPSAWQAPRFPVWGADIAQTGWYGFPALADGTLKIANHGPGRRVHPDDARALLPAELERFQAFLAETFPALVGAPVAATRLCLYCDTFDGNLWIDHHPGRPGLVVAAGDSGHSFKFAPVLGGCIADVVERRENTCLTRFRWREAGCTVADGARCSVNAYTPT